MSYMSGIENSERLHIYNNIGTSYISIFGEFGKPGLCYQISIHIFHGLLRQFLNKNRKDDDHVRYRGASLEFAVRDEKTHTCKWRMVYKNWHFDMSHATLYLLAHRNAFRWEK